MKTQEIMTKKLIGKYYVQINLENHNPHNDGIEFSTLFEAIKYVNSLTFATCKNEMNHTDNDVKGYNTYDAHVFLHEDMWGNECKADDGSYPLIYCESIVK